MRVVGKEGALKGGGSGGKIIENYVMDGQKDNDVISTAYRCFFTLADFDCEWGVWTN